MTDSPFSRPFAVADLGDRETTVEITPDAAERAALARGLDAIEVERLVARLTLKPVGRAGVAVSGRVRADVRRTCVVSLEPFVETVDEPVDIRFAPAAEVAAIEQTDEIDLGRDDTPDPYDNGQIDLGAVVAEFLALGLAAYPRKPGATFEQPDTGGEETSAFAALRKLARPDGEA